MASTTTSTLILLMLHLILLPITSFAQSLTQENDNDNGGHALFNRAMTVPIAVLVTAFFFMGFCSVYLRQCTDTPGDSNRNPSTTAAPQQGGRSRRFRGLEPSIISSFPTLLYSDVKHHKLGKHTLECAVCLTDFDDDDTLRLLPHCSHAFHPECIDLWLSSHTTCPVCRHNLTLAPPPPPPPPPQTEESSKPEEAHEVAVTIPVVDAPVASSAADEEKGGGSVTSKVRTLWRSRTTAGTMQQQQWGEEERERFTLRLPEHVRREVMKGGLRRSATVAVGEGRERRGLHRGEGSSRGGRSLKMRREWTAKSDRLAFLARGLSIKFMKSSGRGGGGGGDGEGGGGGGEGSNKGKAVAAPSSVLSPRDCFSGSLAKRAGSGSGEEDDHLARV